MFVLNYILIQKYKWCLINVCILNSYTDVSRYQRGNQNTYIEEEQTPQWPKENVQKDKQRFTKHTYKTKDQVTRTPLKPGVHSGAPKG
jgi:hypothetical protein